MPTALLPGGFAASPAVAFGVRQRTLAWRRERTIRAFELPGGLFARRGRYPPSACAKSAIRSSRSSMPTEMRTSDSAMPIAARRSGPIS